MLIIALVLSIAIGAALWGLTRRYEWRNSYEERLLVTAGEFLVAIPIIVIVVSLITVVIGPALAISSAAGGYQEFWNGSIIAVQDQTIPCERDGRCKHTYTCDTERVPDGVDSKGRTKYRTVNHDCPYATHEYTYVLKTSFGKDIVVAGNIFGHDPQRFRALRNVPDNVPRGIPARWTTAKQRLETGEAEPVTMVRSYDNYILASENVVLKQYSSTIDTYRQAGLLPEHTQGIPDKVIIDHTQARKVQFAGLQPIDPDRWNDYLMRFNAKLGTDRQGDLHLVIVPASKVTNPDDYITALKANWQTKDREKDLKWSLAKNGVVVAIGLSDDGKTVKWGRAQTGMPTGNGALLSSVTSRLRDVPFTPDSVLGHIGARTEQKDGQTKVAYQQTQGILDQVFSADPGYTRPCMGCEGEEDKGVGFTFLRDGIPISPAANALMLFAVLVFSGMVWGVLLYFDLDPNTLIRKSRSTY